MGGGGEKHTAVIIASICPRMEKRCEEMNEIDGEAANGRGGGAIFDKNGNISCVLSYETANASVRTRLWRAV